MALIRSGNTIYTTADDEIVGRFLLIGVVLTATSANAVVEIHDESGGTPSTPKLELRLATANSSQHFDFSISPIRFETAIQTANMANAAVTLIIKEVGT